GRARPRPVRGDRRGDAGLLARPVPRRDPRCPGAGGTVRRGLDRSPRPPAARVDIGQGDIEHSTIVHLPSLRAVAAGDVVYNKVHMLTALTDATAREAWIASSGSIAALDPDIVVAGHKRVGAPDSRRHRAERAVPA